MRTVGHGSVARTGWGRDREPPWFGWLGSCSRCNCRDFRGDRVDDRIRGRGGCSTNARLLVLRLWQLWCRILSNRTRRLVLESEKRVTNALQLVYLDVELEPGREQELELELIQLGKAEATDLEMRESERAREALDRDNAWCVT